MKKFDFSLGRITQAIFLIISILLIYFVGTRINWIYGLGIGFLPLFLFFSSYLVSNTYLLLIGVFIINYYIMGVTRYFPNIQGGIIMDAMFIIIIASLIVNGFSKKTQIIWKRVNSPIVYAILVWLLYCIFEIFNPESVSSKAWLTNIRGIAFYFLLIVILTQLIINDYKKMKIIIFVWSILTLTAFLKVYFQKNQGFDASELRWLYVDGGARTHLIWSGIRYFSFFTDAANFGCSMAFSFIVFLLSAIGERKIWLKIYFFIVSATTIYGLMLSGTRVAIAIPFVGLGLYIFFSKNLKKIIIFSIVLASLFAFFKFTTIGEGNQYIRRTRTTFKMEEDASFNVRKINQAKIKVYMKDKPFGIGIGLSAGRANKYGSYTELSRIPTDSWLVLIWVETGIIGLILYLSVLLFIMAYCGYIIMFKLKNNELRHYMIGLFGGIAGMIVASYANEAFAQFPNGYIIYIGLGLISVSPYFDKEIEERQQKVKKIVESNNDILHDTDHIELKD